MSREAIASGDRPTILSAIVNQRDRIDAGFVAVFDADGRVVASTAPQFARLRDALQRMRGEQDGPPHPHALVIGDRAWQRFVAPVLAPETIAWIAMGFALDESFARSIRELAGVETLARGRHPSLGEISPGEFAPLAEQIGAIRDLTRWVAREAIRQLGEELLAQLRRHDVPPTALVLEITEGALVDAAAAAARNIEVLQAMGVRFAIDDFGTGHSSLSLLQSLPFDELKIDRSFLAHAHESADDRKIVASTIELAHAIGMKVVAEGVELEASMQLLRELGCDVAQGYLVSRPIAAADVPGFCVRAGIPIPSPGCPTPSCASIAASS